MDIAAILVMWNKLFVLTFIALSHGSSTWNVSSTGIAVYEKKKFDNAESEWPWTSDFEIINYNSFW